MICLPYGAGDGDLRQNPSGEALWDDEIDPII